MRNVLILTLAIMVYGTAAFAQEPRGYIVGAAGFSSISGASSTTGSGLGEVGFHITPRVAIFGNIGRMRDAQSSTLESSLSNAVASLAATDLTATDLVRVPAWYSLGGGRFSFTNKSAVTPYVFGGLGFARLDPSVRFLYSSGTTLSGNDANPGDDITSDVVAAGLFTAPSPTTGLMLRTGGGLQASMGKYLLGNVNYSVSRISADSPIHAQDVTFGLGIKF